MKNAKFIKVLSFVFLLIFFTNCGGSDDDNVAGGTVVPLPTEIRTADEVRADFKNLTFNEGINDIRLESIVKGFYWNFRVIVPVGASETNKRPMIVSLHGGATGNSPDIHKTTACLVEPGVATLNAYILSPNSNQKHWYSDSNIVQIQALVEMTQANLFINTNKVAVTGYSDGGNGSWYFSQFIPNLFSAAIPMASSYAVTSQGGVTHKFAKPIYAIHGTNDQLFPIETTEGYINETKEAGSDVTFVTASGLEHYNSCSYISYLKDATTWLDTVVWN